MDTNIPLITFFDTPAAKKPILPIKNADNIVIVDTDANVLYSKDS